MDGRCSGVKRVTAKLSRNFAYSRCECTTAVGVGQEEKLCNGVKTVRV